jgi:beta-barrel assembly-enhancing protease
MGYQNRQPPEGINVVAHGWQRDFWLAVAGFLVATTLLLWLLIQLAAWGARWTPFTWEQSWARSVVETQSHPQQDYLQDLADRLAAAGGLDDHLRIQVHYRPQRAVNAYATLGGNVFILRGLLDRIDHEQGLAFVMAHEIAHVQGRHPVRALARHLSFQMVWGLLFGRSDVGQLISTGGQLVMLEYSRAQEYEADAWALQAVYNLYGHTAGADELFRRADGRATIPVWMSSHPDTESRITRLQSIARDRGWPVSGTLTPLPDWRQDE